jgi:hypothetical protein
VNVDISGRQSSTVAFGTNGLVVHCLFETTPTDPLTMIAVVALVSTTALVAAFVPARRALVVDPTIVLRAE